MDEYNKCWNDLFNDMVMNELCGDEWMNEWCNEWMVWWMNGVMNGWMVWWMNAVINEWWIEWWIVNETLWNVSVVICKCVCNVLHCVLICLFFRAQHVAHMMKLTPWNVRRCYSSSRTRSIFSLLRFLGNITLSWTHKQFATPTHILSFIYTTVV